MSKRKERGLTMIEKVNDKRSRSENVDRPVEQSGPIQLDSQVQRPVSALYTPWP